MHASRSLLCFRFVALAFRSEEENLSRRGHPGHILAPPWIRPWVDLTKTQQHCKRPCVLHPYLEKKEEIWLSPVTKTLKPTEQSKSTWQHKNATKNFDYTTIADRLRTVSWSNSSHPTGMVKPVYERSTFPLTATAV